MLNLMTTCKPMHVYQKKKTLKAFWKDNRKAYPYLVILAKDVLSVPVSLAQLSGYLAS